MQLAARGGLSAGLAARCRQAKRLRTCCGLRPGPRLTAAQQLAGGPLDLVLDRVSAAALAYSIPANPPPAKKRRLARRPSLTLGLPIVSLAALSRSSPCFVAPWPLRGPGAGHTPAQLKLRSEINTLTTRQPGTQPAASVTVHTRPVSLSWGKLAGPAAREAVAASRASPAPISQQPAVRSSPRR
jgi:hypothetical protein